MISCALLGFGRIGQFHYQTILKHKDKFKLKCIIDPKVNFNLLIPVIHPKDLKQTLEKYDIRAIFVCSPTKYHFDAIQCAFVYVNSRICRETCLHEAQKYYNIVFFSKEKEMRAAVRTKS